MTPENSADKVTPKETVIDPEEVLPQFSILQKHYPMVELTSALILPQTN